MKPTQEFAWDSDEQCFYYINHIKKLYCKVSKNEQGEVYEFLMCVYAVNWSVLENYIEGYQYMNSMKEISNH